MAKSRAIVRGINTPLSSLSNVLNKQKKLSKDIKDSNNRISELDLLDLCSTLDTQLEDTLFKHTLEVYQKCTHTGRQVSKSFKELEYYRMCSLSTVKLS